MSHVTASFELSRLNIDVKYGKGDAAALLALADKWLAECDKEASLIRDMYPAGGRACSSQLDLLDKVKWNVRGIRENCLAKIASRMWAAKEG